MKTRLISAVIGISLAIALLVIGSFFPIVLDLSISLIAAMCVYEALSAKSLNKKWSVLFPSVIFAFLFCMTYSLPIMPILVFAFVTVLFCAMIFNHDHLVFDDLSYAFTVTLLCTLGMWSVVYLFDNTGSYPGIFYIVTALATPWLADAGAYTGGSLFGKHKLCPNISPKKTVEGAVSGVIIGALLSLLVGVVFENFIFQNGETVNYILLAGYALIGSVISVVGDLSFSLIKRSYGIKDFGNVIPGHGGVLDRFDSVIFSAPLLMLFNMFFPIVAI